VLQAKLRLLPGYRWEPVSAAVRERLLDRFGFHARAIAQPALLCEAVAAIQSVRGVDWVDIDSFGAIPETPVDRSSQQRRLVTPGEITDPVRQIIFGDWDSNGLDDDDENPEPLQPPARIDAGRAEVEGDRIRPARLAFFAPAIPDTLILNPVQ